MILIAQWGGENAWLLLRLMEIGMQSSVVRKEAVATSLENWRKIYLLIYLLIINYLLNNYYLLLINYLVLPKPRSLLFYSPSFMKSKA